MKHLRALTMFDSPAIGRRGSRGEPPKPRLQPCWCGGSRSAPGTYPSYRRFRQARWSKCQMSDTELGVSITHPEETLGSFDLRIGKPSTPRVAVASHLRVS
jgi:hypothetical protein